MYANNGWFKKKPDSASEQSNGLWQLIRQTTMHRLSRFVRIRHPYKILKGSKQAKNRRFLYSGMDSVTINKAGLANLKPEMDMIDGITDAASLAKATATCRCLDVSGFLVFISDRMIRSAVNTQSLFQQGGLVCPI